MENAETQAILDTRHITKTNNTKRTIQKIDE
jgi:hypothetical protein